MDSKIVLLKDKKAQKLLDSLPSKYFIKIIRNKIKSIPNQDNKPILEEEFSFLVSNDLDKHEFGTALVFNHVLSILLYFIESSDNFREEFEKVMQEELGYTLYDSNFNK